jgi:hypothetical protein
MWLVGQSSLRIEDTPVMPMGIRIAFFRTDASSDRLDLSFNSFPKQRVKRGRQWNQTVMLNLKRPCHAPLVTKEDRID